MNYDTWLDDYMPVISRDGEYPENFTRDELEGIAPNRIWTLLDGDLELPQVVAGYRLVNALEYYVTNNPWTTGNETINN